MADSRPRVVVAMSGGVDSSVAAALLVDQGYRAVGMMLRLWSEEGQEACNRCCAPDAVKEARRVAGMLGIPFYVIDASEYFRQTVVQDFLDGYLSGVTPNPCLVCNQRVRWGFLLDKALEVGGEYMATGHYARLRRTDSGGLQLLRGLDPSKDQSYVLSGLNQQQFEHSLFPLGEMTKVEVRQRAHVLGLPVADKPDSQDLCFLGDTDYREFLKRYIGQAVAPGDIVNLKGEILGKHQGLPFYTIGQRKGLGIFAEEPYYVLERNLEQNLLVVGLEGELGNSEMRVDNINWINGLPAGEKIRAEIKIRYRAAAVEADIYPAGAMNARVAFAQPMRDITPSQQAVFFQGEICLGGGKIVR